MKRIRCKELPNLLKMTQITQSTGVDYSRVPQILQTFLSDRRSATNGAKYHDSGCDHSISTSKRSWRISGQYQ